MDKYVYCYDTIIGKITIAADNDSIKNIFFGNQKLPYFNIETKIIKMAYSQLNEYFNGDRQYFDIPLSVVGTQFQKAVWNQLTLISYGETRSYKDIACALGKPNACRAVGMANHNNPIPVIIPCHRVIGKNGKLTGYAGGMDIKEKLLNIEKYKHKRIVHYL